MEAVDQPQDDQLGEGLERLGRSPMLTIATGALSVVIGVLVLVPDDTAAMIGWLFAIQLVVTGMLQLVAAFAGDAGTAGRVLLGLLGALTILVGLLCLRAPLQSAVLLGLLIGALWVVGGVIGIFHAINDGPRGDRGWRIASGLLYVLGGTVVLLNPAASLVTLTWLLGIVLLVTGVVLLAHGLFARRSTLPPAVTAPR
jgi:uncharacterized membrane protein HdeD (DUF308 family)